jgi:hypothetical protein
VRWNRKLSEFRSELLRGKEKCPELCKVEKKIEANSPNQSVEEKTTRNFIPWNKNRSKLIVFTLRYFDCILKTNFFCVFPFPSVSSFGINSSADLGMSTFFRGITETVSSLLRGFFLEQNSVSNPRGKCKMFL